MPVIGRILEVNGDDFKLQYWKGSWRKEWQPWIKADGHIWEDTLPVSCLVLVDFKLNNGKLRSATSKYLKEKYQSLQAKNV